MPRTARLIVDHHPAVYHVMSYTALEGLPLGDVEKEFLLDRIKRFAALYFTEIYGFCLMGNHFHLLVKMRPEADFTDGDIRDRLQRFYGGERVFTDGQLPALRQKLASLSDFVRDIKVRFSRFYNRRHNRRGYFWGERFKSVIVEKGETLVNCLAYIDLNPLRAGIVKQPENYRWSGIGYHMQTGNKDGFLSTDFGLREFNVRGAAERVRRYRRYLYEAGAVDRSEAGNAPVIDPGVLDRERQKDFAVTLSDRLRHRTRYFTDAGVIGSKAFVAAHYQQFKHLFQSRRAKTPKPVRGLDGMYSLKRLSEII